MLLLVIPAAGHGKTLADQFQQAKAGDFVVFQQNHHITLFRVSAVAGSIVDIEEVTSSDKEINPKIISWQEWLENGAPHHSSWTLTRIDLDSGKVLSNLSFSSIDNEWVRNQPLFIFLPTLLRLPLETVPPEQRKQVGAPPRPGDIDRRKPWLPKVIVAGKELPPPVPFAVYRAKWPSDNSELSERTIYLYLCLAPQALSYFPYWVEIGGKIGTVKLRVIDSGTGLLPPPHDRLSLMNSGTPLQK
jgi:hypothetical protein